MRNSVPCVGVIVLVGCLTLIIAPDPPSPAGSATMNASRFPTVVIDPGHGGNDEGAKRSGVLEKNETLHVALRLSEILRQYGIETVLTRDQDRYVSLADRVAVANRLDRAIFVSIHFNESRIRSAEGIETFYSEQKVPAQQEWTWVGLFSGQVSDESETLAGYVQVSLVEQTNTQDRGIKSRRFYVVRNTRCPSILVEAGFLSNPMDRQLLSNEDYQARIAGGVASGIVDFIKHQPEYSTPSLASASQ